MMRLQAAVLGVALMGQQSAAQSPTCMTWQSAEKVQQQLLFPWSVFLFRAPG